ncbi:hypothetical protein ANN_19195 [Periplaneta americana]|uniref:Uncharacterized protein n=1 Tax=Periplaneta americana TaxID=6978 RepID=A0ABQ8S9J0_PERAM|nr:hypothetical protein ANN_19195 [Periplaneta americana]
MDSPTRIYFDNIGTIQFYPAQWSLITYVDLQPTKELWQNTKDVMIRFRKICEEIKTETWYPRTDCEASTNYFRSKVRAVDRVKGVLTDLIGKTEEFTRFRRGVLNFVGGALKFLFGTLTQDDARKYNEHIQILEREQREFLHLTKQQLTITKFVLVGMNATLRNINRNEANLKKSMLALGKQLRNIIQKIRKELEVIMILNMYILSIQRGIEECQQAFHQLIDVYLHSQDDILQPQILIIARFTELLQQQKVPEVLVFPILSTLEILTQIKPVIYTQNQFILPVVLYGCETWTITLREEHRLRVFGAKRDEVTGEWKKLRNTELHALYSSPDIIRNIKSRRLRGAGHVARMGKSRNAYRVLVGRPEGKRPLGRPRRRWEDNIKMDLREAGYDERDWIDLAQDRDQWRAYVRAAMNLRVP